MINNSCLKKYRENGFDHVEGWCNYELFSTLDVLDSAEINKVGGCLEIGVHHGKFFILLNQLIDPQYKSYAIDVFEDQHLNIDSSGSGSRAALCRNLEAYDAHRGSNTVIIQGDSTDPSLRLREVVGAGAMRFISVDGGHTVEHTISDLSLASDLINNQGVVILDDILNHHWLGVIEGAGRYLDTRPTLVPFAIGHNKLYMSKLSYQSYYYNLFARAGLLVKPVLFHGHTIAAL